MAEDEIWIVPFLGQGHLLPLMELCKHLASRNFKTVFFITSKLSSSVPSSLRHYPLVEIVEVSETPPPPPPHEQLHRHYEYYSQIELGLLKLLSARTHEPDPVRRPLYAVVDMKMSWTYEIFIRYEIPAVGFFTCGACSSAVGYAMWEALPLDIKDGETRLLPGLPGEMAITVSDLKRRSRGPSLSSDGPFRSRSIKFGVDGHHPTNAGDKPPWVEETMPSIGIMINTCNDLDHPFIKYVSKKIGKPIWGVGPFLPEQYWKSAGSIIHDDKVRTNRKSNVSQDEVNEWLDTKPHGSVLYISFGTSVSPTKEEYAMLAEALESLTRPFIWVVPLNTGLWPGSNCPTVPNSKLDEAYFPYGLNDRVGKRGLIIHGWAPQLLILSHPSTRGFLSHCGWNSTVEAIGRGVPFLAWPHRGDQYPNAKLIVSYLKVGYLISEDFSQMVKKDDIARGIEKLMGDEDMNQRAMKLSAKFEEGFPATSSAAIDAFADFIGRQGKATSAH